MTPFEVSFEYAEAKVENGPFWQMELMIDIMYLIDIILGFTTSYISPITGDEYFDLGMIARHYMKNDFVIDFLSTFWFEELFKYVIRY